MATQPATGHAVLVGLSTSSTFSVSAVASARICADRLSQITAPTLAIHARAVAAMDLSDPDWHQVRQVRAITRDGGTRLSSRTHTRLMSLTNAQIKRLPRWAVDLLQAVARAHSSNSAPAIFSTPIFELLDRLGLLAAPSTQVFDGHNETIRPVDQPTGYGSCTRTTGPPSVFAHAA